MYSVDETGVGVAPLLLSVEEAARALGVHRSTIFHLLASGSLRSVRIGRRRLISIAALEDFISERETSVLRSAI